MNLFLVLPACEEGRGGGHLYRSAALVKALRAGGAEAWMFSDQQKSVPNIPEELWLDKETIAEKNWTLIIADCFRTEQAVMQRWVALGPVLGIDEGLSRKDCDFLIDLLPNLSGKANFTINSVGEKANLCNPSLLPMPKKRRTSFKKKTAPDSLLKILVTFGAEDHAGCTVDTALALKNQTGHGFSVSVVLGPLRKNNDADRKMLEQAGLTVLEGKDLQEIIAEYDLIITHFGITAFEALYARVPVLLINPSAYHEELSQYAGLPFISSCPRISVNENKKKINFNDLYKQCVEQSKKAAERWGLEGEQKPETLADLLIGAKPVVHRNCSLCGTSYSRIAGRFPGRTYRLCRCGTIAMDRLSPPPTEYNRDYFFAEYQKQYGKTYLEDFPKLQKDGLKRIRIISSILGLEQDTSDKAKKRLLDIGCAYGPFLAAAKNEGFDVMGIDPAQDAVEYVRKTLEINAIQGTFPESTSELNPADGQMYDVIALWYVIEHLEDPGKALAVINGLLKTGGVFAFSTPSAAGISRRKSLNNFLENSPADHWTIWDPLRTGAILNRYGFQLKKRIITGHHPERFPCFKPQRGTILNGIFLALSRIFGLGDTFESYAVKIRDYKYE